MATYVLFEDHEKIDEFDGVELIGQSPNSAVLDLLDKEDDAIAVLNLAPGQRLKRK